MKKNSQQSGQALIFAVFGLFVLLGAAGLAVDVGYLRYERRLQQSAADSAALAGAAALGVGASYASAATDDATLNGFTAAKGNNIHVTPTQVTFNGNANSVQVNLDNTYDTFFMKIFGPATSTATVSVSAVAQYAGNRACTYALKGGGGITVAGNINIQNCGVIDDENLSGGGSLTAASIGVRGSSSPTTNPPAITGILQAPDPLSYEPAPGGTGGAQITVNNKNYPGNGTVQLSPGTYQGITIDGPKTFNAARIVHFNPGLYVITGTGLSFQGSGHVQGTGLSFYITGGAVNFAATQRVQLTAAVDNKNGTYPGILFFQDPGDAAPATINGSAGSHLQGGFYFPNATLNMNGAGTGAAYMIFVVKTLNLNTTINFLSDYSSLPNGSPIKSAVLVE
jgi:Flp pilus assembly protein TadG